MSMYYHVVSLYGPIMSMDGPFVSMYCKTVKNSSYKDILQVKGQSGIVSCRLSGYLDYQI